MHVAEQGIAIWAVFAILALAAGGIVLCVLFACKKTRPIAWTLFGLGLLAVLVVAGYLFTSVHEVRVGPPSVAFHDAHAADYPPIDIEALTGPRIQLGRERAVTRDSAHPAHPSGPLEANTLDAAPPEPEAEDNAPAEDPHEHAASTSNRSVAVDRPDRSTAVSNAPPEWVHDHPPREPASYPVVITTDPFLSRHEADRQASQLMIVATSEVVSDLVGEYGPQYTSLLELDQRDYERRYRAALERLRGLGLTPGYLRNQIWRDEHVEYVDYDLPTGEMLRVHVLLGFDEPFQTELQARWREYQSHQRLGVIGMIAASVVGLLSVVWGALKFDTATKGYYTKWLVVGGGLAAATVGFLVFVTVA